MFDQERRQKLKLEWSEDANVWYKWVVHLNSLDGETNNYLGKPYNSFWPIEEDDDKKLDVKEFCVKLAKGEITVDEFYKHVSNLDLFDRTALGPKSFLIN